MGYIIQSPHDWDKTDWFTPKERERVKTLLFSYGVDILNDSTLLGAGAYKEVHKTNVDNTVMIITCALGQFKEELDALDELRAMSVPAMEYYVYEQIGCFIFALAQRGFAPKWKDGSEEKATFLNVVRKYMWTIVKNGRHLADLQFMMDANEQPFFNDPLNIKSLFTGRYREVAYLDAYCKDRRSGGSYCVNIEVREEDII